MTNGILFYAYNNEKINYAEIANINAMLIKKHMKNNNVSVITDEETARDLDNILYDEIIIQPVVQSNRRKFIYTDYNETVTWKNTTRDTAYDLSPYDTTLLLDVDYLIFDNYLDNIIEYDYVDFSCAYSSYDIIKNKKMTEMVGKIPMLWATVIVFRKSQQAKQTFDYMEYVRNNYEYFAKLYGFTIRQFRNDYSLTIANKEMRTWTDKPALMLQTLWTFNLNAEIEHFTSHGGWIYKTQNTRAIHSNMSIHIMNKHAILKFGEQIKNYAKT